MRTARPSKHSSTGTRTWGWTVQKISKRENQGVLFDYLICVALDSKKSLDPFFIYIIPKNVAEKFKEINLSRFKNVKRKLWVYEEISAFEKEEYPMHYNEYEEDVIRHREKYADWELLRT